MKLLYVDEKLKRYIPDPELFEKIERILRIVLVIFVIAIFVAQIRQVFNIPINKPYFVGAWDEPFAVNAGINALLQNGDPSFYTYGGTSVYPYSFVFYYYGMQHNVCPVYKVMEKEYFNRNWPISRKIHPVKPIYITNVIAHVIFLTGSALYTVLFILLLFPAASLIIPSIGNSSFFNHYADLMLPQTHVGLMSGITALVFMRAAMEPDIRRYYRWTLICTAASASTAAIKINAIYILLLPLTLIWRLTAEKYITLKRAAKLMAAAIIPYILINPALLFNPGNYFQYLRGISDTSGFLEPATLMSRAPEINLFLKNLHLANILPAALLLGLLTASCIILARKNPVAFSGFLFFMLFSFYSITTMNHKVYQMYSRHYVFLILPFTVLALFPLAYVFSRSPRSVRAGITLICLLATISAYSPSQVFSDIASLPSRKFTTTWPKESRDELVEFVQKNNAVIYFYDFHGFSYPDTILPQLTPFVATAQIPSPLGAHEYVAFIKYKNAAKINENIDGKYNTDIDYLLRTYETVHVFGPPEGAHDLHIQAPQSNPCIIILKEKSAAK